MTRDSSITYTKEGHALAFDGPDAVAYFRAVVLASSIKLMAKGIAPTRGMTMTKLLKLATEITHKPYKRTQHERAANDVLDWARTMKAALPQETRT